MAQPISLIISFYNKIELLEFIFVALERQTYRNFEVVIADDGSRPEVVDKITSIKSSYYFPIKHVWHEDNGWQKNKILNKAIQATEGEYIIFIDGDCIPQKRFIQEHVENKAINQVISGRRVLLTEKISKKLDVNKITNGYLEFAAGFPLLFETIFGHKKTSIENMVRVPNKYIRNLFIKDKRRFFLGCNFSAWKSDLLKVNGFDERYVYPGTGEDMDLEKRLVRIGVYPKSKKHLVTIYHFYHIRFDTNHEPNKMLYEENIRNEVTFTPFGILKTNEI